MVNGEKELERFPDLGTCAPLIRHIEIGKEFLNRSLNSNEELDDNRRQSVPHTAKLIELNRAPMLVEKTFAIHFRCDVSVVEHNSCAFNLCHNQRVFSSTEFRTYASFKEVEN